MSSLAHYTQHPPYVPSAFLLSGDALNGKFVLMAGSLKAGAVLGRVLGTATPAANAGNTVGSGTIGAVTLGAGVKAGVYKLTCIEPASNAGVFELEGPDGIVVSSKVTVAVAYAGPLGFTISDATDFVAGDGFTITVALAGDDANQVKLSATAATDGSHLPQVVLMHDADATAAPVEVLAYPRGDFASSALSYGAGHSLATVREPLRLRDIHIIPTAS